MAQDASPPRGAAVSDIDPYSPENILTPRAWHARVRELGPLVTGLIIIMRSGVAIAAEVGLMRLRSGMHASLWQDLQHENEVVVPRVLGSAISAAALVSCFQFWFIFMQRNFA